MTTSLVAHDHRPGSCRLEMIKSSVLLDCFATFCHWLKTALVSGGSDCLFIRWLRKYSCCWRKYRGYRFLIGNVTVGNAIRSQGGRYGRSGPAGRVNEVVCMRRRRKLLSMRNKRAARMSLVTSICLREYHTTKPPQSDPKIYFEKRPSLFRTITSAIFPWISSQTC